MHGLTFSLGRVLGAVAGVFKFRTSKKRKDRTADFCKEFENVFDQQFTNDPKLLVHSKLKKIKNKE